MYNRYIPPGTSYGPIPQSTGLQPDHNDSQEPRPPKTPPPPSRGQKQPTEPHPSNSGTDLLGGVVGGIGDLLGGLFKNFSLENLDTGDILLILIILFLFLEGDNLDLVIALGLMLLLGLGEADHDPT